MRQVLRFLMLAVVVVVAASRGSLKAAPGAKDAIAQARKQIASKNLKAAAGVLEDALGDSTGDDRQAILDLLKQTYQGLIRDARSAGRTDEADLYADDLAILEAQPSPDPGPAPNATQAAPWFVADVPGAYTVAALATDPEGHRSALKALTLRHQKAACEEPSTTPWRSTRKPSA